MDLETELTAIGRDLAGHVQSGIVDEFLDFVGAGEYGVGLEILCDRLYDEEEPLTVAEIRRIRHTAAAMGLARPSIADIAELAVDDIQ